MDRRQEIEQSLNADAVVEMVARQPYLLMNVLARVECERASGSEAVRQIVAKGVARTARAIAPDAVEPAGPSSSGAHKRGAGASLLYELSPQLATGQLYSRDLPAIDGPLRDVVDH